MLWIHRLISKDLGLKAFFFFFSSCFGLHGRDEGMGGREEEVALPWLCHLTSIGTQFLGFGEKFLKKNIRKIVVKCL